MFSYKLVIFLRFHDIYFYKIILDFKAYASELLFLEVSSH